jgi:hypothetical protein
MLDSPQRMRNGPQILYCHCAYAQVVPPEVKAAVLKQLCESPQPFEAVADLCELSARRDPRLKAWAADAPLKIAACYPRAVKWLFGAAGAPLPAATQVCNMRVQPAEDVARALLAPALEPNLPQDSRAPSSVELSNSGAAA